MTCQTRSSACVCMAALLVFLSFCGCRDKDKGAQPSVTTCITTSCVYGGSCDGTTARCFCAPGYEGAACQTPSRDKFVGNWVAFEAGSQSGSTAYAVNIQKEMDSTSHVVIQNLHNFFLGPVKGITIYDTLFIPEQHLEGKIVRGKGLIKDNTAYGRYGQITLRYAISDSATGTVDDFGYYNTTSVEPSMWTK